MLWFVNWFVSFSVFCHLSNDSEVLSDAQTVVALSQTIGVNYKLITAAQRYKLRKKKKKKNSSLFMLNVWYWYECILSLFHPHLCTKFWRWRTRERTGSDACCQVVHVGSWLQYGGWNNVNTTAVCLRYVLHQRHWKRRQTFDICREQTYSMSATWCSYRTDEHRRRVIKMAAVLFRVSLADTEHWLHTIISSEPDFITSLHSVFPPPALNPRLHQLTAETQPGKYTRWKSAVWFSQRN